MLVRICARAVRAILGPLRADRGIALVANHRHAVQCAKCWSPYGVQLSRLVVFEQAKSRLVRIRSERLELSDGIAEKQVGLCTLPSYVPQRFDWLGFSLCTEAAARLGGQALGIAKELLAPSCDRADRWISKLRV